STHNAFLFHTPTNPHCLGGCGSGADPDSGVIDSSGRVFGHEGLYVMDGSMISANLGVNPSLTITALSEHVCDRIPVRKPVPENEAATVREPVSVEA
ncbi:MAG: GMC oxidoreductase, partial [Acidobacteriota bacterium]|nr:GMC oxidoreductase [Acidobacteriota bacterium]